MKFINLYLLILLMGCGTTTSLNLKEHKFDAYPEKIVWIQVDGLSSDHLGLLKFSSPKESTLTAFEQSSCIGHAWDYTTHSLRPNANSSVISQLTGKKNIKGECSDFDQKPLWKYLEKEGFTSGIFEKVYNEQDGILAAKKCKKEQFSAELFHWQMAMRRKQNSNLFHTSDKEINIKKDKLRVTNLVVLGNVLLALVRT
jgi:hypothetical protein